MTKVRVKRTTTEEMEVEVETPTGQLAQVPSEVYELLPEGPLSLPDLLGIIDSFADARVGSIMRQPDLDRLSGYTNQLAEQGKDGALIENYVKTRGHSMWDKNMADNVHTMVKKLR